MALIDQEKLNAAIRAYAALDENERIAFRAALDAAGTLIANGQEAPAERPARRPRKTATATGAEGGS